MTATTLVADPEQTYVHTVTSAADYLVEFHEADWDDLDCLDDSPEALRDEFRGGPYREPLWTVSREFHDLLMSTFPVLRSKSMIAHRRLLGHLMFSTWQDDEIEDAVPVPARLLAQFADKLDALRNNNFASEDLLRSFSESVMPIEWSGWRWKAGKCRVVSPVTWPSEISEAIDLELGLICPDRGVYLDTGQSVIGKRRRQRREAHRRRAKLLSALAACPLARQLLCYLNDLHPNRFQRQVHLRLDRAWERIGAIEDVRKREQQQRIIRSVVECPQPFMKPTRWSVRIYPDTENLLSLKREVRMALTSDWLEADLQCAQLAICAKLWDVPSVRSFLRDVGSPWTHFRSAIGAPDLPGTKRALKEGSYGIMYGMGLGTMRATMVRHFGLPEYAERFLGLELIRDLLKARERQFQKIEKDGGGWDAFGRFLPLGREFFSGGRSFTPYGTFNRRSILAQIAQSWELLLLEPIVDLAIKHRGHSHGFSVTLWMHDGFSFVPHSSSDDAMWRRELKDAVAVGAARNGFKIELEIAG